MQASKRCFDWQGCLRRYVEENLDGWFLYLQMTKTQIVPLGQPYPFLLRDEDDLKEFIYFHLYDLRSREAGIALIKLLKIIRSAVFSSKPV